MEVLRKLTTHTKKKKKKKKHTHIDENLSQQVVSKFIMV